MSEKETGILIIALCMVALAAGLFCGYFFGHIKGYKSALREAEHFKLGEYVLVDASAHHRSYRWKWNGQEIED